MDLSHWCEITSARMAYPKLMYIAKHGWSSRVGTGQRKGGIFCSWKTDSFWLGLNSSHRSALSVTTTTIAPKMQSVAHVTFGPHTEKEHSSLLPVLGWAT